ncbi:MAG TPA: proteasome assembly chaperone family protein [Candidatus Poseidoniales archaeon]|nr:MAG TPA: proteasome assembly chaperone family protein [Candidatus Poseidoniales archaeon]|tara:strand:- start:679 stop:1614 length:936 start_codon:yes stop_codon:yes gene_type:complete
MGAAVKTGHGAPFTQGSSRLLIVQPNREPSLSEIHTPIAFGGIMAKPNVKINDSVDTENALVLCCFPSVGMVSSVIAHFLIEKLELEFVGGVVDPQLPPMCLVNDGKPLPLIRAYAGSPVCSTKLPECDKIILLMSELIIPEPLVQGIVDGMLEWSKGAKLSGGVLIDAFAKKGMKSSMEGQEPVVEYEGTDDVDVLGVAATETTQKTLEELNILPLEQGVIKGVTGLLLSEGRRRGLDIMSLMVEADPRYPDARAAAVLISHLNKLLPAIELDHEPLIEEAERIEEQVRQMMEATTDTKGPDKPSSMLYG